MEKKSYEAIKSIRTKVANGTSTFAERNILHMFDKRIAKAKKKEVERASEMPVRGTKRFGGK